MNGYSAIACTECGGQTIAALPVCNLCESVRGLCQPPRREMTDLELAVCLGTDALRIALGQPPINFTHDQVAEGIRLCAEKHRTSAG